MSDIVGRCWEVALGDRRSSPYHLGRRRDTGQPGETIEIPIKTGEQPYLTLPAGEGNGPIIEIQLPLGGMHQRQDRLIETRDVRKEPRELLPQQRGRDTMKERGEFLHATLFPQPPCQGTEGFRDGTLEMYRREPRRA